MITGNEKLDIIILVALWVAQKLGFRRADKKLEQAKDWIRTQTKRAFRIAMEAYQRAQAAMPSDAQIVSDVAKRVRNFAEGEGLRLPDALWELVEKSAGELLDEHFARDIASKLPKAKTVKPRGAPSSVRPIGF